MAKCPVCRSRKGKRPCPIHDASICPACCGTGRAADKCGDCGYFKPATRDYGRLSRYHASEIGASDRLSAMSYAVEAPLCWLDQKRGLQLKDAQAIEMIEVLLDMYAFGDTASALSDRIAALDCAAFVELAQKQLQDYDRNEVARVLSGLRFVAQRRNIGGRHHMDLVQSFVGAGAARGITALPNADLRRP